MANYWVITIGINQYRHIQPLMHAQNDALFVHKFFTEEAAIAANHCVLLSDLATSVGAQTVYPDKPAIAQWIQTITSQVEPGDVFWFYFSGYGTQVEGADYLMPIDGDLDRVEETGIALLDLIDAIAKLPTDKAVLALDINRSQGALAGQTIGAQVIELAQKRHVAALLSCQPEQYSHETLGVRHGLFTAALLEALQQGYSTLGQISNYLTKRLPELCEHHWRPVQNAVTIASDEQKIAKLIPELTTSINSIASGTTASKLDGNLPDGQFLEDKNQEYEERSKGEVNSGALAAQTQNPAVEAVATGVGIGAIAGATTGDRTYTEKSATEKSASKKSTSIGSSPSDNTLAQQVDTPNGEAATEQTSKRGGALVPVRSNSSTIVPHQIDADQPNAISGAKLRNWGLFVLALLMGLVLLKQPFVKAAWDNLIEKLEVATGWGPGTSDDLEDSEPSTAQEAEVSDAQTSASTSEAAGEAAGNKATSASENTASENTASENTASPTNPEIAANNQLATNPPATNATDAADAADAKAKATALIAQAEAAIAKKQYSEALIALKEVPKNQRDNNFSRVLIKARVGASEAEQANAALLTDALTAIQPTQASQFTEAIAKARLIQPGEPLHEDAQKNIQSWSQTILDIAEGRAATGNLESAIAAAQVLPKDNAAAYQKAQNKIAFWQQRQQSREIIELAKTIPKTGQASTYQEGIVKLREVPIEHPEYETSERLADEWSDRIFSIAQARAAQGRESAAIQAAVLVPAGTTAYEPAQQAIRRWRTEAKDN